MIEELNMAGKIAGKAVLTCRPNSHPFLERTLSLDQPVKIGRSVARARPGSKNAIFDCKVLSRNHALIWYNNGKFYLQDTKSSNGTFVNNHRLSKSGEESIPREVCSGDIVQFGVDVLENTRKVTHGCIVANLKLYLPDGKEAKASLSTSVVPCNNIPVENLYELYQYLQEAAQREQLLENKLVNLQELLTYIMEAADQGWKALIAEDRLLTRVDALESQLVIYSKNIGEDKLKDELKRLQEEKDTYQNTAKEFIKKILEEKLEAVQKYQDIKRSHLNVETQYSYLNEELNRSKIQVQELALKLNVQMSRTDDADMKMKVIDQEHRETVSQLQRQIEELEKLLAFQKDGVLMGGQLLVDLRAPGAPIPYESRKVIESGDRFSSPAADEEDDDDDDIKKDAADLYTAQLELLQYYGSGENQLSFEQDDLNTQIRTSDVGKNGCDEEQSKPKNLIHSMYDYEILDSKENVDYCGINVTLRDEPKASNDHMTKSLTVTQFEKASEDYDGCHVIKKELCSGFSLSGEFMIEGAVQDNLENHLNRLNQNMEEKDVLRKQLMEAEQHAKQSRNEAAQLADRMKILASELESVRQQQHENTLDNKLREELHKLTHDYFHVKSTLSLLQVEIDNLKEDNDKLEAENTRLLQELRLHCDGELPMEIQSLFRKIRLLEASLVLVSHKYRECNDEKTQLRRELRDLQLDYKAITHQPYFNLFFGIPCIVLVIAIIIVFYPTLSKFLGTADGW